MVIKLFCLHRNVRCVHFNESERENIPPKKNRVVAFCMSCESYVHKKKWPDICYMTKKEHW